MLPAGAFAAIVIPFLCLAATGQTPTSSWDVLKTMAPGTEVRVAAGSAKSVRGKLESVTDNSFVMKQDTGTQSFPRPEIHSVAIRKNRHRWRKVLIGMGAGMAAGLALGGAAANNCSGIACGGARVAAGGIIGLIGGAVAGLAWSGGEWRQVYAQ